MPVWLQIAAHVVAIIAGLGGIFFAVFVLWPSIRRSNRTADKVSQALDRAEKKGLDSFIEKL